MMESIMIQLISARITNFRSCIETEVDFHPELTALIGINGSGKTNTLSALLLLRRLSTYRRSLRPDILKGTTHSTVDMNLNIDGSRYRLVVDLFSDTDRGIDEAVYSELKIRKIGKGSSWHKFEEAFLDYLLYRGRALVDLHIEQVIDTKTEIARVKARVIEFIAGMSYYSATQFSDPSQCPVSIEIDERSHSRYGMHGRLRGHEQFIYDLYRTYKEPHLLERYLSVVGKDGLGLIDDIHFGEYDIPNSSVKVLSAGHIRKIDRSKLVAVPSFTVGGLQLSPNQLSEGTFKTLALVFYILTDNGNLLLIEEPEVCVHHGLLSSIVELIKMRSKTKQIVISTHSDYVLDKLSPENVILVTKSRSHGTKAMPLTNALSKDDYKSLKHYLNEIGNLGEYWKESGFINE